MHSYQYIHDAKELSMNIIALGGCAYGMLCLGTVTEHILLTMWAFLFGRVASAGGGSFKYNKQGGWTRNGVVEWCALDLDRCFVKDCTNMI